MKVHAFKADLHLPFKNIIADLIVFIELVPVERIDPVQESAVKAAQGIQVTIGKVYRKHIVIAVVAVLGSFYGKQPGAGFIIIVKKNRQLFVIRYRPVRIHELARGKYANDQRNPDR
jgi:hypothetical protein